MVAGGSECRFCGWGEGVNADLMAGRRWVGMEGKSECRFSGGGRVIADLMAGVRTEWRFSGRRV